MCLTLSRKVGECKPLVTGGVNAPFELSIGEKRISVGDIHLHTDLHVQYGEAGAPMFEVDVTLRYVVGGAPAPISGSGSMTFRVPLDGDGVTAVTLSTAIQLFPEGVPQSIRKGRRVALSGGPGLQTAKLGAPELSIGGFAVSGLGVTAAAFTLADRLAHHGATLNAKSVAGRNAASQLFVRGVEAVMAGVGLNLTDFGVTLSSVVDTLLASGGDPAAIKAGIFDLFYRATSIASKLRADGAHSEMYSINVESLIEVLTMLGDADADGISALDPGIAALVKGFQAGNVEMRALADAVFSFLVITEDLAWSRTLGSTSAGTT